MRLKHVHISDYKNLRNFDITFDSDNCLDVFVGKNGSGKSNFFEALIEIFRHLNELSSGGKDIDFGYRITYEINGVSTSIEWTSSKLKINGRERKTLGRTTPLPDNVLIYYSGHNDTVSKLIVDYQEAFQSRIKGADFSDSRYFLGIGADYKQLLLTVSLLRTEDSSCRRFICQKLGIAETGTELRLVLKRPYYARSSEYDVLNNDDTDKFWKADGITRVFLNQLVDCAAAAPTNGRVRTEGYVSSSDKYILYLDPAKIAVKFQAEPAHELFNRFDNLKVLEMLEDLSIPLKLTNGEEADTSFFSDGQFQSVYIFAITELFKERHCLTLLDEPDSFLHPEWQHEFLSQIFEISEAAAQTNHTLLSSHSASTISSSEESLISLFEIDGTTVKVSRAPKDTVITSLSAGLITFSESEARLSIHQLLSSVDGPVLFTEGISDDLILETAWKKLYPAEKAPFAIQNAFCCSFLGNLLRRGDLHVNHPGRVFLGLFDFDDAYNEWKGCKGEVLETDPSKCLARKLPDKESYAMLLPVPRSGAIRSQVINDLTGSHYEDRSRLSMELLFHGVDSLSRFFELDPTQPGGIIRFVGDKVRFAKEVVPSVPAEHFAIFEHIFDFVKSKCTYTVPAMSAATS
jgi:predicted ATPase